MVSERIAALLDERRPKRADARRNFDALVESARGTFTEHGLDSSLEEIARRAGVGIGTLYRNFPTRDALVEAVYVEEVAAIADYVDQVQGEPFDALATWLRRFADYVGTKHVLLDGLNRDSTVLQSCRGVASDAAGPLLARAQAEGAVRGDITMDDIVRLIAGLAGGAYVDRAQRDRVLDLAIEGLRAR